MITFFRKWKEGMRTLTPLQLLESKLIGIIGQVAGLTLATGYLWFMGFRFFIVFMAFTIFLSIVEFISTWKQYDSMNIYR